MRKWKVFAAKEGFGGDQMEFHIDEVPVYFPYPYIYPEQYQYMVHLKRLLDKRGTGLLEVRLW